MNSDMRVHTPSGLDTYTDISVYCGDPELGDDGTTLLNPTEIIEVLSPSARDYDRGGKFAHYSPIQVAGLPVNRPCSCTSRAFSTGWAG